MTNCPGCGELGLARFAHYHVCTKHSSDDSLPMSMREILERIASDQRYYFRRHPEAAVAVRSTEDYQKHVEQLHVRASQLPEGHWGYGRPHAYVELLTEAYVWARLVE